MNLRCLLVAMLVCAGCLLSSRTGAQEKPEPKKPAKATIEAWNQRGFTLRWMGTRRSRDYFQATNPNELRDAVPAFTVDTSRTYHPSLEDLPSVEVPFGLNLGATDVKDAKLKELARLKNLSSSPYTGPL